LGSDYLGYEGKEMMCDHKREGDELICKVCRIIILKRKIDRKNELIAAISEILMEKDKKIDSQRIQILDLTDRITKKEKR